MKLIDILARELKEWPAGVESLSQLKGTGYIINGKGFDGRAFDSMQLADETRIAGAIVTRAQWQAAVDALKAAESAVPVWQGVGLPPVGTVCEVLNRNLGNAEWERCTILYSGKHRVVYSSESCEERTAFIDSLLTFRQLRFIRTPEQIAADEREKAVKAMIEDSQPDYSAGELLNASEYVECAVYALYDAGYRKQVAQ